MSAEPQVLRGNFIVKNPVTNQDDLSYIDGVLIIRNAQVIDALLGAGLSIDFDAIEATPIGAVTPAAGGFTDVVAETLSVAKSMATDAAATTLLATAPNAYPQAVTNTGGGALIVSGGIGKRIFTVVDYTGLSGETATVTINNEDNVLTEGVDWDAEVDEATTATNLAAAVDALDGVSAVAVAAVVHISAERGTFALAITNSDDSDLTDASGAPGAVMVGDLPAADPEVIGRLWNNGGVLTVSAGPL
jgi:hypothetical protein